MIKMNLAASIGASILILNATWVRSSDIEVLHWWTSTGEAASVKYLKSKLSKEGIGWTDFAIAGGGGESAMTVLKSRAISGNPPTAALIKGPSIQEWADLGFLLNLDSVANKNNWNQMLPEVVSSFMKHNSHYYAVPVNVHRVNWLWANPEVFRKSGATIPTTWDDFFVQAQKIKDAGFIALAHGSQPWQDATLFEDVVLGIGGPAYYKKAFVDLDTEALKSDTTKAVFETFGQLRQFVDPHSPGRDWNIATSMVINGNAGMQLMGDWAKGDFLVAGGKVGTNFICVAAPGTSGSFTFNIDSFVFFTQKNVADSKAQKIMAREILSDDFQKVFNLNKGSIPAKLGIARKEFDACAQDSMDAFLRSTKTGGLVPSFAHGMAVSEAVSGAISDSVTHYFNSKLSANEGVSELLSAIAAAR